MYDNRLLLVLLFVLTFSGLYGQTKKIIHIPDIPGYQTLKCDFHIHTVFSDGTVWPTVRVQEAASEGLDAIAITDHIEYQPHSKDIVADHNRSYEIAKPLADEMGILLVRGTEITRSMPPGHLNALFISNANLIEREDVNNAIKEARDQGAFILWNHPCWDAQQPDTVLWWQEHTQLFKTDKLHGIEVYNGEFCTEALEWAVEKNLSMFGNSDMHKPSVFSEKHRPMTLVFAKSKTVGGIKEALFSKRTVVYFDNNLAGKSTYLEPLFFESIKISQNPLGLKNTVSKVVMISNNSDIDFELELVQPGVGFDAPEKITLKAQHKTGVKLTGNSEEVKLIKTLDLYYQVNNLITDVDENLVVTIPIKN